MSAERGHIGARRGNALRHRRTQAADNVLHSALVLAALTERLYQESLARLAAEHGGRLPLEHIQRYVLDASFQARDASDTKVYQPTVYGIPGDNGCMTPRATSHLLASICRKP
jgi:hypothetical protein